MLPPDTSIADTYLTAGEVYFANVDLEAEPPGVIGARKVLRGQTDTTQNGLYESYLYPEEPAEEEEQMHAWKQRLCPSGRLYLRVGDGVNVGQNVGKGAMVLDGTGIAWGTDAVTVIDGWPSPA